MTLIIRALALEDDRSAFRSGNIDMDRFFQRFAGQNHFRLFLEIGAIPNSRAAK